MNYELAKQLKDAGFPFNSTNTVTIDPVANTSSQHLFTPTLEELIEACGERFAALLHYKFGRAHEWEAHFGFPNEDADFQLGTGSTPTEAVARLWLALNNNDNVKKRPPEATAV